MKFKRVTDMARNIGASFQPKRFTSHDRHGNAADDAQHRRYNRYYARFEQPDPADSSYNLSDPQSLNRYSYTQNDPVNFIDPSGLNAAGPNTHYGGGMLWTIWYGNNSDGYRMIHQWFEPYPSGTQDSMSQSQYERLRGSMAELLQDPKCASFVTLLLGRLEEITGQKPLSENPLDIFDAIRNQPRGGLFTNPNIAAQGEAGGSFADGTANLTMRVILGDHVPNSAWLNGGVAIHENVHLAPSGRYTYGHTQMAQAAWDVSTLMGFRDLGSRPTDNTETASRPWKAKDNAHSTYFTNWFFAACGKN